MKYDLESASWEITLKCNLKCFHCEFSAGKASPDELSTEEAIKLCEDLAQTRCKRIILMGGEPFLRKDWFTIAKRIKALGMELAFITNGYATSQKVFSKLRDLSPTFIGVSIDGGTAQTHDKIRGVEGSFVRALEFADTCIKLKLPTIVITSIHKLNISELPILRDLLFDRTILWEIQMTDIAGRFPKKYLLDEKEFYYAASFIADTQKMHPSGKKFINGAHDMGYNSDFLPNLTGLPKWEGCQAGISLIGIESNGGIKGCSALTTEFVENNVRKRNIVDIWNDPNSFIYNRKFRLSDLKGYCKECEYAKSCKGGCMETSYMTTRKIHCDPYCFHRIEKLNLK